MYWCLTLTRFNWVSILQGKLLSLIWGYARYNQGVDNPAGFLCEVKSRLKDSFWQLIIHSELEGTSRGKTYLAFNVHLVIPSHFKDINVPKYPNVLCIFRLSIDRLSVYT